MNVSFSKNSWHYWIAKNWGGLTDMDYLNWDQLEPSEIDICTYTRKVIKGLLVGLLIFFLLWVATRIITDSIVVLVLMFEFGHFVEVHSFFAILGGAILGIVAFCGICWSLEKLIIMMRNASMDKEYKPSFISTAYRSFKEKYCIKINIK